MNSIEKVSSLGQSLWYDNIQRSLLANGSIEKMIQDGLIKGITSNPSIFQKAISQSKDYDNTLKPMSWSGLSAESIFWRLAVEDIRNAADLFLSLYKDSHKKDGYVSLEVNPLYANDTEATIREAKRLWNLVDRSNLMIKIPATPEGIPAIRKTIADGINVNVTLIFSIKRYSEVIDAYMSGLEDRLTAGKDISSIASVASFFVSRLDTKIDDFLENMAKNGIINTKNYEELAGKAAIANARLAYRLYEQLFAEKRFENLRTAGAQTQRPLWASTSTKNHKYRDVVYVEELIGKDTVNTVPPATLDAFKDHGIVDLTIIKGIEDAENLFVKLHDLGISIDQATLELENEGVKSFADAFTQLLEAVEQRRVTAVNELGSLAKEVKANVIHLQEINYPERLYTHDPTLWTEDKSGQDEIVKRMNWLQSPWDISSLVGELSNLVQDFESRGFSNVVLLGMGGSSLAPEVLSLIHKPGDDERKSGPKLFILDSTDPDQVLTIEASAPIDKTLYVVASKSGTTGEINAFFAYFWEKAVKLFGSKAGTHFIAITDPGTKLQEIAQAKGFRKVFTADPKVGGRNSALTAFGLVPAALIGWNIQKLLENAKNVARLCQPTQLLAANPGVVLGAIMGGATLAGRDKITFIADPLWQPLGAWLEQLIAESSGKNGKGIVPVADEPEIDPWQYDKDRLFVYLRQSGERVSFVNDLLREGHPVITIDASDIYDIGGQFYMWEVATATACSILGVNSFDQPNVQDAKTRTLQGLEEYKKNGKFPELQPVITLKGAEIMTRCLLENDRISTIQEAIHSFLTSNMMENDYIAINAFLPRSQMHTEKLQLLRENLLKRYQKATTLGFGPRYLHSTGQLHKGGANNGLFLLITATRTQDAIIPGEGVTFSTMQRAQALGDLQALEANGRRVLWIDLAEPDPELLLE